MISSVKETFSFRPRIVLKMTPLCYRQGPFFMREKVSLIKVWQQFLWQQSINFFADSLHAVTKNQSINRPIWRIFSNLHDYPWTWPKNTLWLALTLNLSIRSQLKSAHIKMREKKIYFRIMLKNKNTMWKYWSDLLHLPRWMVAA